MGQVSLILALPAPIDHHLKQVYNRSLHGA